MYLQKRIRSLFYFRKHFNSTITMIKIGFDSPKIEIWYGTSQLFQANAHLSQSLRPPPLPPWFSPLPSEYLQLWSMCNILHKSDIHICCTCILCLHYQFWVYTKHTKLKCLHAVQFICDSIATINKNKIFHTTKTNSQFLLDEK